MNRLGKIVSVLVLGLCGTLSSCTKTSSGASGAMFIESCGLNCSSNGAGGGQVSCGVSSIFQNQEIGVLFSKPVQFGTVGNQSFQISDSSTGSVPVGAFLADPFDARRVIFRPDLSFDINGNPVFGFTADASYDIFIPGKDQGDSPPFISSTGGTDNATRLACTVTTDLGISDPVAGPPVVSVFVSTTTNPSAPANGATGVLLTSQVTMVFNDLMNIGTLVLPGTGTSPSITAKLDPDGNIANTADQVPILGLFTFNLDQLALQTTVVFTPSMPFPSAGANLLSPRKIIINLQSGIKDVAGNTLANPGPVAFTPQQVIFAPVTIPPGGEQFTSLTNCDQVRSGLSWGETAAGRLTPGLGGGSGRLGDLSVASGETLTLHTGPTFAIGRIKFTPSGPLDGDTIEINTVQFTIVDSFGTGGGFIEFEGTFPALTLNNLIGELNNSIDPLLTPATYSVEDGDTVRIIYDTTGDPGLAFTFDVYKIIGGNHVPTGSVISLSGPTVPGGTAHMLEGVANESFAAGNLLDNFDYQATPGGTPNPILVTNGVFEFASLNVAFGGTLRFEGPNSARVLVRGNSTISGLIDVSGESKGTHLSDSPRGQPSGFGGPNAGNGGVGGDRPDNSGTNLLSGLEPSRPWNKGIVNPGGFIVGGAGVGVGQVGTIAAGPEGTPWPLAFPFDDVSLGGLQTNAPTTCESEQIGGTGGGGAYSLNGGIGVAVAVAAVSSQGGSNTPPDTAGGDAANVGLEVPTAPPHKRKLTPEKGFLNGGSGGGGGSAHVSQTRTNSGGSPDLCVDTGAVINIYRSHSASAGGGGGGAIQLQAGRSLVLSGGIDASGGDGGDADEFNLIPSATLAAPGGAGSGGAILMQAGQMFVSAVPNRMSIAGGLGGLGFTGPLGLSTGGFGGPGLARVEAKIAPLASDVASILDPVDPLDPLSINYLSVGTWVRSRFTPASFQGAQSCWMRPTGNFFAVQFTPDAPGVPGWDMDLVLNFGAGDVVVPYRSPNGILPAGQTYEQFWGQLLDADLQLGEVGAPLVVRFQGAKLSGAMPDPCNVDLSGPTSPLAPGSLTPWARHPSELNFFGQAPDMIRFTIIFDASKVDFLKLVGVTNLRIEALPN